MTAKEMMPVGPLMVEHRLIERMIRALGRESERIRRGGQPDAAFLAGGVDFLRGYADRCHHGKEEDILFKALRGKSMTQEHRRVLDELIDEHSLGRKVTGELSDALERLNAGDKKACPGILAALEALLEFYPRHILKEDRSFFMPCMGYFSPEERERMMAEMMEFDRMLIHERYTRLVEAEESRTGVGR